MKKKKFIYSTNKYIVIRRLRFIVFMFVYIIFPFNFSFSDGLSGLRIDSLTAEKDSYGVVSASRTSGVAPLCIHFSTDYSLETDDDCSFHKYDYYWDFDDSSNSEWGTTGKIKNNAKGAMAAHVYETPGDYEAVLTVRDENGVIGTEIFQIRVLDSDDYYYGDKTVCINPEGDSDFSRAPSGSTKISTDDLSTITQYATEGRRLLLKRGASWSTGGLSWPANDGPVTIGAYGDAIGQDDLGIYNNAPQVEITSGSFLSMSNKKNYRVMDISFTALSDGSAVSAISGGSSFQQILLLRLNIVGFDSGISWSSESSDQLSIVSCDISNALHYNIFAGGNRIAILGNNARDSKESHVMRIFLANNSVISHNMLSGSNLENDSGLHALKFQAPNNSESEFTIISNNVFGSSGPWPINIGPENSVVDERVSHVIFERNRIITEYGNSSSNEVTIPLHIWARYITVRNNIFDGTGSGDNYIGIMIEQRGIEPPPIGVRIYNNTFYRFDSSSGYYHTGIRIEDTAIGTIVKNNLVVVDGGTSELFIIDNGINSLVSYNICDGNISFVDPDNADPLSRSFELMKSSSDAINMGYNISSVLEDFNENSRPYGQKYDIGAFEYLGE